MKKNFLVIALVLGFGATAFAQADEKQEKDSTEVKKEMPTEVKFACTAPKDTTTTVEPEKAKLAQEIPGDTTQTETPEAKFAQEIPSDTTQTETPEAKFAQEIPSDTTQTETPEAKFAQEIPSDTTKTETPEAKFA